MVDDLHAALLYYGNTHEREFPLVLVIGREPNTEAAMGTHVGTYNFREYPHAGIWNIAYSLVAEEVGLKGWKLKRICESAGSSPLIFGNALPIGIKSPDPNKLSQRQAARHKAREHIQNVFASKELISRVGLVLASGLQGTEFSESREAITAECCRWNLPAAWLPFFYGAHKAAIKSELTLATREQISKIVSAFFESHPKSKGKAPNPAAQPDVQRTDVRRTRG